MGPRDSCSLFGGSELDRHCQDFKGRFGGCDGSSTCNMNYAHCRLLPLRNMTRGAVEELLVLAGPPKGGGKGGMTMIGNK